MLAAADRELRVCDVDSVGDGGEQTTATPCLVAFTTVVGPLIEVPVLLVLVDVAPYFGRRFDWRGATSGGSDRSPSAPSAEDD